MRLRAIATVSLLSTWFCCAQPWAATFVELNNLRLIDGTGVSTREVSRLIARDGVIVAIDSEGATPVAGAGDFWTRIDLGRAWVIPGLIDTHVHVARFPDARTRGEAILQRAVRGGITAVRDLAGDARALAELERASSRGEFVAPDLVFSALFGGPDIFGQGPTSQMASGRTPGDAPWARLIESGTDLRLRVAEARGSGVTNIKLYGDMDAALCAAVIAAARAQGVMTTAHATVFTARPSDLVEAGIGSLAHAPYLVWEAVGVVPDDYGQRIAGPWNEVAPDHPRLLALYRRMAERGVTLDATLYVYKAMNSYPGVPKMDWTEAAFAWAAAATRHARAAGVRVTTGTDWFEPRDDFELPHTHDELELLVDAAGFTPMQALQAATRDGAFALGRDATQGTLEIGKLADLVVLEADPLQDIGNTKKIRMTLRRGVVVMPD